MTDARQNRSLTLFATATHDCPYLPDRRARNVVVDPWAPVTNADYGQLLRRGLRRSGPVIYAPSCPGCNACQSLRVPAAAFRPRRRQRRCWHRNSDLQTIIREPQFRQEHFDLYQRYVQARHPGGGMEDHDPETYMHFLVAPWSDTRFVEWRCDDQLLAVAVVDRVDDGLSAVYTFFEPDQPQRSLGRYAILWQIDAAQRWGLTYVYLGYWIAACRTMRYKAEFRPCEVFRGNTWQSLPPDEAT